MEFFDVGSPLSNKYYIASPKGEIYGLDHNKDRFSPESSVALRPDCAEIPGLYLTGQDVFTTGLGGAMLGGLICAGAVLNRTVYLDMVRLRNRAGKSAPQNEDVQGAAE